MLRVYLNVCAVLAGMASLMLLAAAVLACANVLLRAAANFGNFGG